MTAARDQGLGEEVRFRELFESAPDGVFIAGADGIYTDVNAAGCRMLGYTRDELVGKSVTELVRPGDLPRQSALTARILAGGREVSEWELRRKDGTYLAVELSSNTFPDGRMRAIVRDITERREAEVRMRLSELKFSGIVEMSADAILTVDDAQRITMVNASAEHMFGYPQAAMIGAPLEALIPERFRAAHRTHVERFAGGQESGRPMGARSARLYGLRKGGEEFPVDASISRLEVGGARLLIVSMRDISEQRRVEDEQRLLAETGKILVSAGLDHQRILTDFADLAVRDLADWCIVDLVRGGHMRRLKVAHADPQKAALCDALEQYPFDWDRPSLLSEVLRTQRSALMSEVPSAHLESVAQGAEHLELLRAFEPKSIMVVPLIARGQVLGALVFGSSRAGRRYVAQDMDVAERLADRLALAIDNARLHAALEQAIHARDGVLAIVAHDLRNPLNAIALHAQMLRGR
ncbi:MAG TPA: PAS domain S-box protein, partial [Labilithrix sp.]|nr:PAS domain S-box protein [Labilithrix sp.]